MTNLDPHCVFGCSKCGERILLPYAMLQTPIAAPTDPSSKSVAVIVSCPECRHVEAHRVKNLNPNSEDSGGELVWLPHSDGYSFLSTLACGKQGCEPQLAVFAPRSHPMT